MKNQSVMKTKVVFKKISWFNAENPIVEINAIFPEHSTAHSSGAILYEGYAHIGQHTSFHKDFLVDGKTDRHIVETATEEEYKELKTELESIGYELEIV